MEKVIQFTPKECEGFVKIERLNMPKRLRFLSDIGFDLDDNGQVSAKNKSLKGMADVLEGCAKHVLEVDLKKGDKSYKKLC